MGERVWGLGGLTACLVFGLAGWLVMGGVAAAQVIPRPPAVRKPLAGFQPMVKGSQKLAQPDALEDAGDFYTAGGKRIRLLRSKDEVVVRHAGGAVKSADAQAFNQAKAAAGMSSINGRRFGKSARLELLRSGNRKARVNSRAVNGSAAVDYAFPVLVDPKSGKRMIPTDEILIGLANGVQIMDVVADLAVAGVTLVEPKGEAGMRAYLVRLTNAKTSDPLAVSKALAANPKLRFSTPNFVRELTPHFTPSDPLLTMQQALNNTGQNGAAADADVDATEAWDRSVGSSSIVIAIIDDGVDTSHPDLRIAYNPGESGGGKETNGIDDDGDGFIDNFRGWDFANGDNNPDPVGFNGHGTGCAGVAAAIGNNAIGTAGIANGCKILPVKVADDSGDFTSDEAIGAAISYAGRFADVLSNSYGGGAPSPFIDAAIDDATLNGRHGKGCPVFFATGNSASTWYQGGGRWQLSTAGLSGNVRFGFFYLRGPSSGGEDTLRVDNVCLLDSDGYTHKTTLFPNQDFEGDFPPTDWPMFRSAGATSFWTQSSVNALHGTGGQYSASSPSIAVGEYAWLFTSPIMITGTETLAFAASADMPEDSSFYVDVYDATFNVYYGSYGPLNSGEALVDTETGYPASSPNAIAVGAATDCDLRSDYSQYGGKLDFVASSNGGWNDIATLDPVGSVGWTGTDYKANFGGTSSACPLAAGVAALMLSMDPTLTRDQVLAIMRGTCDKIGGVTYTDGTNPYYGHGRVNAARALAALNIPTVTITTTGTGTSISPIPFTLTFSEPVTGLTTDGIIVTNGVISGFSGSGATYTVFVTPAAQGTVSCQVKAGAAQNAALRSNVISNAAYVIFDATSPTVLTAHIASNNILTTNARAGNAVIVTLEASEAIQAPVIIIAGHEATVSNTSGNIWKGSYTMTATDAEGVVPFSIVATDVAGNTGDAVSGTTDGSAVLFDRTAPTISVGPPSLAITRNSNVTYQVTYADANFLSSTLTSGKIFLSKTGTATGTVGVSGNGTTRTVTISNIGGNGTLGISISAGSASDTSGNTAPATGLSGTFVVDNSAPSITISQPSSSVTATSDVTYLVTYSDTNFNASTLAAGNITLNKTGTANGTVTVTGTGATRTVTVSGVGGNGTLGITIGAGTASDTAGNISSSSGPSATFAVDNTPPAIAIGNPSIALTKSTNVTYLVSYADGRFNSSTLSAADVTLNKTGTANAIAGVSGSGFTRTVTLSGISGNGTIGISIGAGTASDQAGNFAAAAGPSATFKVDNTAPTLSGVHLASDNATGTLAKAGDHLTISFTANEAIQSPTIMLAGWPASLQHISGNNWTATLTVAPDTLEGPVTMSVAFSDIAGNAGATVTSTSDASTVSVDLTPPVVTAAHITSTNGNPQFAKAGDTLTLTFTASEPVQIPSVNIAGLPAEVVNVGGNVWTAALTLGEDVGQGAAGLFIHFSDLAGNEGTSVTGTSDDSTVIVDNVRPEIITPPSPLTVNPQTAVTFEVAATSLSPISYQWVKGTDPIPGATSAAFTIDATAEEDEGNYAVIVSNVAGSTRSEAALLKVNDPVKITRQPLLRMVNQNEAALFSVSATGTGTLTYQWRRNGNPINGALSSSYTIAKAQPEDEGLYDVVITNIVGDQPSESAELVVLTGGPKIVAQPASCTVTPDMSATFSVTVEGTAPFSYQWIKAGISIPNATSASYTVAQVKEADAGIYAVYVYTSEGYAVSDGATLTVAKSARYTFTTLAGTTGTSGDVEGNGYQARFLNPQTVAMDNAGNIFIADRGNHTVRKVTPQGETSLLAGKAGIAGTSNGRGDEARFSSPAGIAIDGDNNLYVTDSGTHLIRKITPEGVVKTVAGRANLPGAADGAGGAASFRNPQGIVVDRDGIMYVADSGNHTLRKILPNGTVSTFAGLAGAPGKYDDVGPEAYFNKPTGLALDAAGNIYVADEGNHAIRKVTPGSVVTTIAGLKGTSGLVDAVGTAARFKTPDGIAVDGSGNLYVCDTGNNAVRMITASGGVTTIGGNGSAGSADGAGAAARFRAPQGICVDTQGSLYLTDTNNHTIRRGKLAALPEIVEHPASQLIEQGHSVSFRVIASGEEPMSYQWRKNGAAIAGATQSTYTINGATLTSAGNYSAVVKNAAGSVTTIAARLGVVSLASRTLIVEERTTATVIATTAGDGLAYQWRKDGVDLAESVSGVHSVSGVTASKLVIKAASYGDSGNYTCQVRLGTLRLSCGVTHLKVYNSPPLINLASESPLQPAIVSGTYSFALPMDPSIRRTATAYSATGLPPGMKIDSVTGLLSGRPTIASPPGKPYRITITASNARGKSSVVVLLAVSALPVNAIGTFSGLVEADQAINEMLGGHFTLVSTSTGSFSGNVVLAGSSAGFSGVLETSIEGNPTASVTVAKTSTSPQQRLQFHINVSTGELHGSLTNNLTAAASNLAAWRSAASPPALAGLYTTAITSDNLASRPPSEYPQGDGYASLQLSLTGSLMWSGKLSDGTAFTASSTRGPDGQAALHAMLYANTGSIQGWSLINPINGNVDGAVTWLKKPQSTSSLLRSYHSGFPAHALTLTGNRYVKPITGQMIFHLPSRTPNAQLVFSGGALPDDFSQLFTITPANSVLMPSNDRLVKIVSFNSATGLFGGLFTLNDAAPSGTSPAVTGLKRTASFSGALVQRLGRGAGYFLLQRLPEANGQTVDNTEILSGRVSLEEASPTQ